MIVDDPETLAEVTAVFYIYEKALLAHDAAAARRGQGGGCYDPATAWVGLSNRVARLGRGGSDGA